MSTNQTSPMGLNRTGLQTSPLDAERLIEATTQFEPDNAPDQFADLRLATIEESDAVGSVPPPVTPKGMLNAGMQMLAGHKAHALLDKLAERLAFERTGTRLYEAFLTKCEAHAADLAPIELERVREFRDDEQRHARLVDEAIRTLGGDPTAQTPCADLTGVESMGLLQVVTDPRSSVVQSLHAVLIAELADEAAWEMLAMTLEEAGQAELAERFRGALAEERLHLHTVRTWYEQATRINLGIAH